MALDNKKMTGNSASGSTSGTTGKTGTSASPSSGNVGIGAAGGHVSSSATETGTGSLSTGTTAQAGATGLAGTPGSLSGKTSDLGGTSEANTSAMNWEEEDHYWSENYRTRPYASQQTDYQRIRPAYQYGASAYHQNEGLEFDALDENTLRSGWESQSKNQKQESESSAMGWEHVKDAVKDAYNRMFDRNSTASGTTPATRSREKELA